MMNSARILLLSVAAAFVAGTAIAQDLPPPTDPQSRNTRFNVQGTNFDMWCQEERHLPPARCDKRLPEDDEAYNAYVANIERYEVPYLQEQQKQIDLNRGIIHNDPVDHPNTPNHRNESPTTDTTAVPQ